MAPPDDDDLPQARSERRYRGGDTPTFRDLGEIRHECANRISVLEITLTKRLGEQDTKLAAIERTVNLISRVGMAILMLIVTGFFGALARIVYSAGAVP